MTYNLVQLIEHAANRFLDKEVFKCSDNFISYAELDLKANKLASYLTHSGIRKGDRVAIYMNRCLDTAVAVYGILKSGGAFVAIDPFSPINRVLTIMKDCGVKHIITTPTQSNKIKSISKETSFIKSIIGLTEKMETTTISWESIFSRSLEGYQPPEILEHDLASILYTSGSTGIPKGIMHTHKSLLSLARLEAKLHDSNAHDIIGNFAPLHFDQSYFGYFSGPLVGAKTVIFPDSYIKLPASLAQLVAKEKITLWFSVPLILVQILAYGQIDKYDFSHLRWVRFGGEVFPVQQLRKLMQKWPHAKFINSYGPSELVRCTYYILSEPPATDDPIPIGTVWGNTEYKIIDKNNHEVKKGQPGELIVRTETLMAGYWNNKELTEKVLYRIREVSGNEMVYYRTGDLFQENDKKELLFLGRIDRQVKLRGFRIELDEIENTLLKNKHVQEVAAIVVEKQNTKRLEGVVKLVENSNIEIKELIQFCKTILPPYSVPEKITKMKKIPRTGSGKIDRPKIIKLLENQN